MKSEMEALQRLFAALADPTRVRIVGLLRDGPVCVCHIYEALGIPQSKASRHLAYLRRAGLVVADKRGLWVHYSVADTGSPAAQAVLNRVRDTLAEMDLIKRDAKRLARHCCAPSRKSG